MSTDQILTARDGAVATVTVNRPAVLNALDAQTVRTLTSVLTDLGQDDEIRCVVLTGAGDRAFVAGADITELARLTPTSARVVSDAGHRLCALLEGLGKPVIAAVNGLALAGACELMQVCDIKIASENAILGEPEIRAGLGPPFLITPFSVSPMKAKELLLTGDTIDAQEALRLGMINRVVPQDQLMYECERTAKKICLMAQVGVKMTKRAVNRVMEGMGFLSTIEHNLELMVHFETSTSPEIDAFNEVRRESGLKAALNWRDDRFRDL